MASPSPLSDAVNVPSGTTVTMPPGTTVVRPSNQPEWVIVFFIIGAVILGLAGLMWNGAASDTIRHDCYNLALVLASTAGGNYVSGRNRPQPPTP